MGANIYEERLGTQKMLPLIVKMTLPGIAAQLINLLYSIVDRIYIGHIPDIGTNALAGVGVTSSILMIITAFSSIVGMGAAPLASIALGEGNRTKAEYIIGNGAILLLLFALLTAIPTYCFMEPILLFSGASLSTLPYASDYLTLYMTGTLFVMISTGLNSFISLQGRPSVAMWAVVIGAALNILLDYIFIFPLDMGIKGAALATVIAQGCSAGYTLWFLLSSRATLRIKRARMHLKWEVVLPTLALGFSPLVMSSTEAAVGFVLNGSLKHYGDLHISAMAVMQSALLFAAVPLNGFAQGFTPIIGYNYGTGNVARVKECFKIAAIIMTSFNFILVLSMIVFPDLYSYIFSSDEDLVALIRDVMPVFLIGMTLFGIQRVCQSMFIALGEARISIMIALLRKVILLIPMVLVLQRYMGVMGVYWGEAISDGVAAILCGIIFFATFPKILKRAAENKL